MVAGNDFYGRLYLILNDRVLKITKFCKELNYEKETIMSWKEQSPSVEDVRKISKYLGCSFEELLGTTEIKDDFDSLDNSSKAIIAKILKCKKEERQVIVAVMDLFVNSSTEERDSLMYYLEETAKDQKLNLLIKESGFSEEELFAKLHYRKLMRLSIGKQSTI